MYNINSSKSGPKPLALRPAADPPAVAKKQKLSTGDKTPELISDTSSPAASLQASPRVVPAIEAALESPKTPPSNDSTHATPPPLDEDALDAALEGFVFNLDKSAFGKTYDIVYVGGCPTFT